MSDLRGALIKAHLVTEEQVEKVRTADAERKRKEYRASHIIARTLRCAKELGSPGLPRSRYGRIHTWFKWYLDERLPADCAEFCFICGDRLMSVATVTKKILRTTTNPEVVEALLPAFADKTVKPFDFSLLLTFYAPEATGFFSGHAPGICDTCRAHDAQKILGGDAPAAYAPSGNP